MSNPEEAKEVVKDIEVYAKPPESAIYYRNDDWSKLINLQN